MDKLKPSLGFTLIEILVVLLIVSLLALIIAALVFRNILGRGGDAARKAEIVQIGRILTFGCYLPEAGGGEYDIIPLLNEIFTKKPQFRTYIQRIPKDPRVGTEGRSGYIYTVSVDGKNCALYANLESNSEQITLPNLTNPTPGGGSGVLKGTAIGVNGTNIYFQVSSSR